jgi:carboxymethylenebutenolidase
MPACRPFVTRPIRLQACVIFAALVVPAAVSAEPIQEGKLVSYKVRDEQVQAYLVRPQRTAAMPGVVVIHEWWGLNDQIKRVTNRLAEEGFVAIAPDLYRGKLGTDAGLAHELMRGLNENYAVDVVAGAVAHLRSIEARDRRGPAPTSPRMAIGTLGFCMGGRISLATALSGADVQAAVMFYGSVETSKDALAPLQVPLLGIFGNEDRGIPLDQIRAFQAALKDAGKDATVLVYAGVGHAFFNDDRPSYDREAANDAWERTKAFFRTHLPPGGATGSATRRPRADIP